MNSVKIIFSKIKEIITAALILGLVFYTAFHVNKALKGYLNSSRQYREARDTLMVARVEKILRGRKIQYLKSREGKKAMFIKSGFIPAGYTVYRMKRKGK